jgi:serine/threonine-protein kinase
VANQDSIDGFLETLRTSGLLPEDRLSAVLEELRSSAEPPTDAASLAEALVRRELITPWQSEMLLKGKRRGYLLGPYVLLRPLGQGAMGQVFLAQHLMMHRRCAIKILAKKYREDPELLARFQVEARAIAALDHPHIVRAYDFNRDTATGSDVYYLVMEYVDGQDLQRVVDKNGPLGYQVAAEYIRQAAVGLAHAHEAGFIHRDIKPGNLLVDNKGVLKILDLGLARLAHGGADSSTEGRWVSGTPDYIAPEQILNRPDLDGRADIYSLGLTFYFLLLGRRPYVKKTMPEILAAHCKEPLEPIDATRPDIPYDLTSIIDQMTAKLPERRYRTAGDVAAALQTWLQNEAAGQSSRLSAIKTAAMRSRHRVAADAPDAKPKSAENVDLELVPVEEPRPPAAKSPGGSSNRSTSRLAAPAETAPTQQDERRPPGNASSKPARLDLPPLSSAVDAPASLPAADLLATLPPVPKGSEVLPILKPVSKRKPKNWRERLEVAQQSPWFWVEMIALIVLAVICLAVIVFGLAAPHEGIEESDKPPENAALEFRLQPVSTGNSRRPLLSNGARPEIQRRYSNGVACVRVQRTNVQHLGRSLTRSAPT